jgi:hypothetical protein
MAKKKLLNEVQVRRFMSLSGLQPLKEMYGSKMEEEEVEENIYEEEAPAMEEAEPEMEEAEPEMDAAPEADEDEVSVTKDTIDAAGDAIMSLLGQLGYQGGEAAEPEMDDLDLPAEEPEMEMGEESDMLEETEGVEEVMEDLSGVNLELNEDELVQEVAKRVAKRILKAKQAQEQLDEALGNKKR